MTAASTVSVAAAAFALVAALGAMTAWLRTRKRLTTLEAELDRGKEAFRDAVHREAAAQTEQLENTMALTRAQSISLLVDEERRITEERRRDVAERERDATAKLGAALAQAQRSVEKRLGDWSSDLAQIQESFAAELQRISARQQQLTGEIDAKLEAETGRVESTMEEHRSLITRLRTDLDRAAEEVAKAAIGDLDQHAAERRRALQEVAERLKRREQELHEVLEREQTEINQRVATQVEDIERRQLEGLRRAVSREAARYTEGAGHQFDAAIRAAREDAARRLGRELDLAVERFARETEGVLAERVDAELRTVEARLQSLSRRVDELVART